MNSSKARWILVFSITAFIFIFLWAFRPFGLFGEFIVTPIQAALGYAGITFLFISIYVFDWNYRLAKAYGQRWTIGRHLVAIFSSISLIGIANGFYVQTIINDAYLIQNNSFALFFMQFVYTHAVGLFPVILVLLITEARERNYYAQQSNQIQTKVPEEYAAQLAFEELEFRITGENEGEIVVLTESEFLFARASGNYVDIFYRKDDRMYKEVFRLTLQGMLDQIGQSENIFQTHRSYVVNLCAIANVEGNAQGYKLSLTEIQEAIPVSRSKIMAFNHVMNNI